MQSDIFVKVLVSVLCLAAVSVTAALILKKRYSDLTDGEQFLAWLTCVLPFAYGGYYAISAAAAGILLLIWLLRRIRKAGGLRIDGGFPAIGVSAVVLFYVLSVLWAANHGMALYGIAKYFPLLLYMLFLMQLKPEQSQSTYVLVPFSGACMVAAAMILQYVPAFADSQIQSGQLAGFFEYPNTFALFLLVGVAAAVLQEKSLPVTGVELTLLILGILKSGSRIGVGLLTVELVILCVMKRKVRPVLTIAAAVAVGIGLSWITGQIGTVSVQNSADATGGSTMLARVQYWKDALPVILKHPFGLGYWGYAATEQSFQHGVYGVSYVHNDLLQLFLDIGWLPTILFCIGLGCSFFSRKATGLQRLVMFLILAHCMFEFHLEYLSIWMLLLAAMQWHSGRETAVQSGPVITVFHVLSGIFMLVSVWLGTGEALSMAGNDAAAAELTPVYSPAVTNQLTAAVDITEMEHYAKILLRFDSHCAIAYDAMANVAYGQGDIMSVLENKEQAIACDRYELSEYLDYFDKLYEILKVYQSNGDKSSAEVCRQKLLGIPDMLQEVLDTTDPIAWKVEHKPELELPEEYQQILAKLGS